MTGGIEENERVLSHREAISVLHGDDAFGGDRAHRTEEVRLLGPEGLSGARDEPRWIDQMLEPLLVDVHLRTRHRIQEESGSPGMIQMDVGDDQRVDVAGSKA